MEADRLQELATDIVQHGLQIPIVLFNGQILDGRNRYLACREAGVTPLFEEFKGSDPVAFVISLNARRRDLTESQRAVIALHYLPLQEEQASKRKRAGVKADHSVGLREGGKAAGMVAKQMNISEAYVEQAKRIQKKAPEKLEEIRNGKTTINAVMKDLRKEKPPDKDTEDWRVYKVNARWTELTYRVLQYITSVDELGGMTHLTRGWNQKQLKELADMILMIRDSMSGYHKALTKGRD